MNHEQVNAVKGLAAPVNKVLEGLEVECGECNSDGFRQLYPSGYGGRGLECRKCNGKKRVKYSWTPQVGEWMMWGSNELELICQHNLGEIKNSKHKAEIVPILPWEEIERVLKKAGYKIKLYHTTKGNPVHSPEMAKPVWGCHIIKGKYAIILVISTEDIRQEAVMKAVRELGKELNEKLAKKASI